MAAEYPSLLATFTPKEDDVQTVDADHMNKLQEEVAAIQAILGVDPNGGNAATVRERAEALEARTHTDLGNLTTDSHPQYATFTSAGSPPAAARNGRLVRVGGALYFDTGSAMTLVGTTDHAQLSGLGAGNPHPQYFPSSGGQFGSYSETFTAANASGTYNLDVATANNYRLTITGNTVLALQPAPSTGFSNITVDLRQNATGGYAVSVTGTTWNNGVVPAFPVTANATAVLTFFWNGQGWKGVFVGSAFA